jgi:four helix bundle protein
MIRTIEAFIDSDGSVRLLEEPQLQLRSGTTAAPNYAEARGAESHSDFIHKLRIVLKELNETAVWLQPIVEQHRQKRPEASTDLRSAVADLRSWESKSRRHRRGCETAGRDSADHRDQGGHRERCEHRYREA